MSDERNGFTLPPEATALARLEEKGLLGGGKSQLNKSSSVMRHGVVNATHAPYAERIESCGRVERVQLVKKNGIWEISLDGIFRGHYHDREHALAAVTLAKLSLS